MAGGRTPGPQGRTRGHTQVASGPLGTRRVAVPRAPAPAPPKPVPRTADELGTGNDELGLLQRVFGPAFLDTPCRFAYIRHDKSGWHYQVDEYLRDRDLFFGSAAAYRVYRDGCVIELDADKEKLRRYIEPNLKVRGHKPEWKAAQVVFYAWTRRAFQKQLGENVDIAGLIKAGMSDRLRAALQQVRVDYGKAFQYGGFNPRPMKKSGAYRLGTLSDHALGSAIDIDATHNPQIESAKWNAIMAYTGVSALELGPVARKAKWKSKPQELHQSIQSMSAAFVSKLQLAVAAQVAAGKPDAQALEAVVAGDPNLKLIPLASVRNWRNGFLALPWALVKELHEEKFLWGATFGTVDLHHFELPKNEEPKK
jgi:hypothetical protein